MQSILFNWVLAAVHLMIAVSAERGLAFWQRTHAISSIGKYSFAFECHQFGFFFLLSFFLRRAGISTPITAKFSHSHVPFILLRFFPQSICIHIYFNWLRWSKRKYQLKISFNSRRWPPLCRRQHPIDRLADERKKLAIEMTREKNGETLEICMA